jgi:hypothetical protein
LENQVNISGLLDWKAAWHDAPDVLQSAHGKKDQDNANGKE